MDTLVENFSTETLTNFFKKASSNFKKEQDDLNYILEKRDYALFSNLERVGNISFKNTDELIIFACRYQGELSERSSKKKQFDIAKIVLKDDFKDGAIFVFYDELGRFRFSFIKKNWGEKGTNKYSSWKRFTFFVNPKETNKTFRNRIGNCSFKDFKSVEDAFSVEKLTKEFYNDLFKWYTWVLADKVGITFPNDTDVAEDDPTKLEEQIIRLITRVLFVWFIKQKRLVPNHFFDKEKLSEILRDFVPNSSSDGNYYNAILQNLFFATLNKPIQERDFAKLKNNRDIKTLYRYAEMFKISEEEILDLFRPIPFLNGGLFECLDKEQRMDGKKYHSDGFSRNAEKSKNGNFKHRAFIPNCVFFGDDKNEGLIPLLGRYNFTVEENAPNEQQVALDPELLGNVFENLLGAFNEETKESARKQSGSFYTPKEVVAYMTDESLIAYLQNQLPNLNIGTIRSIFEEENLPIELQNNLSLCEEINEKLRKLKILDPACGSGAFPMGILSRMVEILEKLDVQNKLSHYDLKLHLIQECIYGVDIQTIAAQISKLRFFISLIVEQGTIDFSKPEENYGVWTLPNLETKFIAANTLIGLENQSDEYLLDLKDSQLQDLQNELLKVRESHFYAKSASKKVELRKQDEELRVQIVNYLIQISSTPNQKIVQRNLTELEKLKLQRKEYGIENWVDNPNPQIDIFGETSNTKIDSNAQTRRAIDSRIKLLNNEIEKENRKAQKVGLEAILEKISKWNPYDQNVSSPFFDPMWMFGISDGFDIVIGNPPYISTKGISEDDKKELENNFGFADDTYNHFFFKGYELLKKGGVLSYITPKTYWTTQTKRNLRDLILSQRLNYVFDTANPFESAMVDTCITSFSKIPFEKGNEITFLDGSESLKEPLKYSVKQEIFLDTQNSIIFKPTEYNLKIHSLYGKKVKELYDKWWDKIKTSRDIANNEKELKAYREDLKAGDIALLGCLTEGGQGLATANNGKYIAVRKSTKWADNIIKSRPKKLAEAVTKKKIKDDRLPQNGDYTTYLNNLSEKEIARLFDDLKEKYGRDIFGQGYIYKLVDDNEIADVETLTQDEKDNGIDCNKKFYVPYDKGDKDGNRWYLETPFAIAWTKENVGFLKTNSGKKGQGMPVVRNPQFYFKEGFCWTDVNSTYLKSRLKKNGVFDVLSMSLFTLHSNIPDWYYVCLINSRLISLYVDNFINNTSHFQINDARQLPIVIPTTDELSHFEKLFKKAVSIKEKQFSSQLLIEMIEQELNDIQTEIDSLVNTLYGI
ncbi:Eco57I restriction-modification methylase domain-containing protein [Capnocytophaga cynodegmi]|uniref:Eco57I restriction-modification methylase domain-containing protein n=1 Tax=Capnocytophaga cynodegmi TaxID=28189 RepID=UPI00385D11E4